MTNEARQRRLQAAEALRATGESGGLLEAVRRAVAIDETYARGWLVLGGALADAGEYAEAEDALRTGLRLAPARPLAWFQWSNVIRQRGNDPAQADWLFVLALRACAVTGDIPDLTSPLASAKTAGADLDLQDPEQYRAVADIMEAEARKRQPEGMPEALLPYDLLLRFAIQASEEVKKDLLDRVRGTPACVPVFHAALRDWLDRKETLSNAATGMIAAVLGEAGGPEVAPELIELCVRRDQTVFDHGNWALWRLGQRMPAETMAAIVAATPSANLPQRCAFAEHLGLLPAPVDAEPALKALLSGDLSDADDAPNAGYLVVAVSDAFARRGRRSASRSALQDGLRLLDAENRKWAEDKVRKRDFVPRLVEDDIVGHSLEEVCLERLLVDEEDDYGDEDENEIPPLPRPGRNDPCWCGSGKKYKKCHLAADDQAPPDDEHSRLLMDVIQGAHEWQNYADVDAANELYFGYDVPDELEETEAPLFFEWMIRDFRAPSSGKTIVEEFLRRRGHELTARRRRILEAWRDSRYGLYEVQRVEDGKGVALKDYFTGEEFFVHDVTSSKELVKWDTTLSRIESIDGRWEFSGIGLTVPRTILPKMVEFIEQERGSLAPEAFVRANAPKMRRELMSYRDAPPPALRNTDDEPFEFCTTTYEIADEPALLAALASTAGIEEREPGREFGWVGKAGLGENTSLGRIEIDKGKLKLECNSRPRLARGKALIEEAAGKSVRYLRDNYESMASVRARMAGTPLPAEPEIDPEIEREVVLKAQAQHYATWPDHPLPALDGQTPRQAMTTEQGRRKVLDLVRMMENGEERNRKAGRPAFDFSGLRRELGLPPE